MASAKSVWRPQSAFSDLPHTATMSSWLPTAKVESSEASQTTARAIFLGTGCRCALAISCSRDTASEEVGGLYR